MRFLQLFVVVLMLCLLSGAVFAQDPVDPGESDTLRILPATLVVGESRPVDIWFYNDEVIEGFMTVLSVTSLDGGFARIDSMVFVDRLGDPSVLNQRVITEGIADGVSSDSFLVLASKTANGHRLAPGQGVLYQVYLTGLEPGQIVLDSLHWLETINLDFVTVENMNYWLFHPYFRPAVLSIISAESQPSIALPAIVEPIVCGNVVSFDVSGESNQTENVAISLESLTWVDDESHLPTVTPTVSGVNPITFDWRPGSQDVGVWLATFKVSDGLGGETMGQVAIQVVGAEEYLVQFETKELPNTEQALGMTHGDFDGDGHPEVIVASSGLPHAFAVYEYGTSLREAFTLFDGFSKSAPQVAFFNGDDTLDLLLLSSNIGIKTYAGNGDNSFSLLEAFSPQSYCKYSSALLNANGDGYLDLALSSAQGFGVLLMGPVGVPVAESLYSTQDSSLSVSAADFNGDGWDDVAVGTVSGLEIYLNDGEGGFGFAGSYSQVFGTRDIQVTNQGSDVNNDGRFDLCLSTPSVGGTTSNLMLYLGNVDGSFSQHNIRTVKGQIFANCLADLNNDAHLDIAYVNGAKKYVGVLLGDGTGAFLNELRYDVPSFTPFVLDCMDLDTDGDMDMVVSSYKIYDTGSLFIYMNQTDPPVLTRQFEIRAHDNARLEITAPDGAKLDETKQVMPASAYFRRSLNDNAALDAMTTISVVEPGAYLVHVAPKPNLPASTSFSLMYQIENAKFRIAEKLPMAPGGYTFMIYPDGNSPIQPTLGAYVHSSTPYFSWPDAGVVRFELATDVSFSTLIDTATVSGGSYTTGVLLIDDSTTYYWRVYPHGAADVAPSFNSFTVVRVPTDAGGDDRPNLPSEFAIYPNYPNPFNPNTTLAYDLPVACHVTLEIYNLLGQHVVSLVDRTESAGSKEVIWNGQDKQANPVTSGIYFYRLTAGHFQAGGKMLMLK